MKELVYKIIDFFTFGKGLKKTFHGHALRLPTRYINYFPSDYEVDNFNFLKQRCKSNDIVLDIGAHIGLFAVVAAQLSKPDGKVYAFEPAPSTNSLLKKTIALNKMHHTIEPRDEAMGKENGKTTFYVSDDKADNSNSLVSYKEDRELHGIDINIVTIDGFVQEKKLNRVNFMKIDVEGAEYDAIRGGTNTFKTLRPYCILAIHPEPIAAKGDNQADIYDFIFNLGYKITFENKELSREELSNNKEMIDLHLIPI
ncbi:MAG: FkbM family methyltransferase [Ferruginibacter sp.]